MISVIIPIYNQEKYIDRCIKSLLDQMYDDLQIILINDGSEDDSYSTCLNYIYDSRIELHTQENAGVSAARNKGLQYVKGEWIAYIDPDDYLENDYFQVLESLIEHDVDIVACCCKVFEGEEQWINYFFEDDLIIQTQKDKRQLFMQLMDPQHGQPQNAFTAIGVPWGKLYRTDFIKGNNLVFNEKLIRQQDNIFNMYAFHYARKIKYINRPLYNYCVDNVKNYYWSKFNKRTLDYCLELQREREFFLTNYHYMQDEMISLFFSRESLDRVITIISSQILHGDNDIHYKIKKKQLKELLEQSVFLEPISRLDLFNIKGLHKKIVYFFIKLNFIEGICWLWRFKRVYHCIKRKFILR